MACTGRKFRWPRYIASQPVEGATELHHAPCRPIIDGADIDTSSSLTASPAPQTAPQCTQTHRHDTWVPCQSKKSQHRAIRNPGGRPSTKLRNFDLRNLATERASNRHTNHLPRDQHPSNLRYPRSGKVSHSLKPS